MNEALSITAFVDKFKEKVGDKYVIADNDSRTIYLTEIAPALLRDVAIVRIRRANNLSGYWKTLLFTLINSVNDFNAAFNWVASVKEELVDPESSDLYFIGGVSNQEIPLELCTNIESSDQLCRKYILRPNESITSLVERTFLSNLVESQVEDDIVDPLYMAIQQTANRLPDFGHDQQEHWRQALLSGRSGAELIDNLFKRINYDERRSK